MGRRLIGSSQSNASDKQSTHIILCNNKNTKDIIIVEAKIEWAKKVQVPCVPEMLE